MDVARTAGIAWGAALLMLAGCCLDVVPDVAEPTSGGASSSGGGFSSSGVAGGASGTGGAPTSGGTGGCAYPVAAPGGGEQFPYEALGEGWVNLTGVPDANNAPGAEPTTLLQLHCSGDRFLLVDLSAAWSPHSQTLGMDLPNDTTAWLAQGGLVLTVLEQGPSGQTATQADLTTWATEYGTNFSLVNDPDQSLAAALGVETWPSLFIVRLSDMQIINSDFGAMGDSLLGSYAVLLAETFDGGT